MISFASLFPIDADFKVIEGSGLSTKLFPYLKEGSQINLHY